MQVNFFALRMYNVFICVKANKKPTNEKINPLDYINMINFYLPNKLIKLKVKWKNGKYLPNVSNIYHDERWRGGIKNTKNTN